MRGAAAICVVLFHGHSLFGIASPDSAYLAVDFFFVLSGFILAHAYTEKLRDGLGAAAFLRARIVRLYPLYIAGSLTAVILATASYTFRHDGSLWTFEQPLVSFPFALFMLPSPASDILFPLDPPAWSLLLELVVNAAFAVRWLRTMPALIVVVGLAGVALMVAAETCGGLDVGWKKGDAAWGLARVLFSFPFGVILYRVHLHIKISNAFSIVPVLALIVLLYAAPAGDSRIVFDLGVVFAAAPVLVLTGAISRPTNTWLIRSYLFLGVISYPLYVLHYPSLSSALGMIDRHVPKGPATIAAAILLAIAAPVLSWYAASADTQFGLLINRRLHRAKLTAEIS